MKKKFLLIITAIVCALMCAFGLAACDGCNGGGGGNKVAVESISFNETALKLEIGDSETLTVNFSPKNATDKDICWSSSEPKIASVDNTGKVTANLAGTATITATTLNNKTATCQVTVTQPAPVAMTEAQWKAAVNAFATAKNFTLQATANGTFARAMKLAGTTFYTKSKSGYEDIFVIDGNDYYEYDKRATDTDWNVYMVNEDLYNRYAGSSIELVMTAAEAFGANYSAFTLKGGKYTAATLTVADGFVLKNIEVTCDNNSFVEIVCAYVEEEGDQLVTIDNIGTTEIEIPSVKYIPVESITLDKTSLTLEMGEQATVSATVSPANATEPYVTWSSSNEKVIHAFSGMITSTYTVQYGGLSGTATLTATTLNGKTATCEITVNDPHTHSLVPVLANEPTCTEDGNSAYYTCEGCDKWFSDELGESEITDKSSVVIPQSHNLTLVPANAATCQNKGNKAYYICGACGKWFNDVQGLDEITDKSSVETPKGSHNYVNGECTVCHEKAPTEGLTYESKGNAYYVGGIGTAKDTDIVIPSEYKGYPVTGISANAFSDVKSITSITIPDSVTTIESYSISCSGLTSITIPANVTTIEDYAFACSRLVEVYNKSSLPITAGSSTYGGVASYAKNVYTEEGGSKLTTDDNGFILYDNNTIVGYVGTATDITIPVGMSINEKAFYDCVSITSITIPEGVTRIGQFAFEDSSLASVTLCSNSVELDQYAFTWSTRLVEVYNKSSLSITAGTRENGDIGYYAKNVYTEEGGSKLTTDANGFVIYDNNTLVNYVGTATDITIPDGITAIYDHALSRHYYLASVTIPEGVTSIGEDAFFHCYSLTSVTLPTTLTEIGGSAFMKCRSLTSVVIPSGVEIISDYLFNGCKSLVDVTLPSTVSEIGKFAFVSCSALKTITYQGTTSSWNSITKGLRWDYETGSYSLKCTG